MGGVDLLTGGATGIHVPLRHRSTATSLTLGAAEKGARQP